MASKRLLKDVEFLQSYVKSFDAKGLESMLTTTRELQARALAHRSNTSTTTLTFEAGTQLINLINTGPWTPQQLHDIQIAITSRVETVAIDTDKGFKQTFDYPHNYSTQNDVDYYKAPNIVIDSKLQQADERHVRLGCFCLTEQSKANMVAFIINLSSGDAFINGGTLYNRPQDFKRHLKLQCNAQGS